jgi:hypothetical protein
MNRRVPRPGVLAYERTLVDKLSGILEVSCPCRVLTAERLLHSGTRMNEPTLSLTARCVNWPVVHSIHPGTRTNRATVTLTGLRREIGKPSPDNPIMPEARIYRSVDVISSVIPPTEVGELPRTVLVLEFDVQSVERLRARFAR